MVHLEENVMTEAHAPIEKRKIVNRFLTLLTKEQPQMYYATTSEISRSIHTMIKEHTNRLTVEEQALTRRMSIEEIEALLGFHTKQH
jgi:regulator of replication initiation timing